MNERTRCWTSAERLVDISRFKRRNRLQTLMTEFGSNWFLNWKCQCLTSGESPWSLGLSRRNSHSYGIALMYTFSPFTFTRTWLAYRLQMSFRLIISLVTTGHWSGLDSLVNQKTRLPVRAVMNHESGTHLAHIQFECGQLNDRLPVFWTTK